jgi:hypothetical protein
MLNASNRWKDHQVASEPSSLGDLILKTPQRRPSLYVEDTDDDSLTLPTSPIGDSLSTLDCDDLHESLNVLSFFESAATDCELRPRRAASGSCLSGHRSDSYLFVSQLAAPENKHLRRSIRFAPSVEEREYAITVDANLNCSGPCALTLDWEHAEPRKVSYNDTALRGARPVRQLAASERREWLQETAKLTADELRLIELQTVSEQVESLQKELTDISMESKACTRWPGARQSSSLRSNTVIV